ncbi:MAG: alpha/beta hydrolase [Armatimonadetes bacterium]|nr:alpha/beta hydrolase [Armatimonadota bacterium]
MILGLIAASLLAPVPMQGSQAKPEERRTSLTGVIKAHPAFESKILGNKRDIWVYLPPNYGQEPKRRYPVLYMHDGQNVFDGMTSYIPNMEWRADEAAEALIRAKAIEPILIVAVSNATVERANEYLPTRVTRPNGSGDGGKADLYGRFLTDEVMPFVDKTYRTKKGPQSTGLCGSSFGGVATLHLGLTRPEAFGRLAVVSPSIWWDDQVLLKETKALKRKLPLKIWLDMGTLEGLDSVANAELLKDALAEKGWKEGNDLLYYVDVGAKHNEAAWAGRMDAILLFLFGIL